MTLNGKLFKFALENDIRNKILKIMEILDNSKVVQYYNSTQMTITDGGVSSAGCIFELVLFDLPSIVGIPVVILDPNDINGTMNETLDNILSKLEKNENITLWQREEVKIEK